MKKVLIISDLTCYGEINMLPTIQILSAFDLEIAIMPTSITSSIYQLGDENYISLTDQMEKTIEHYREEHIKFDCIYTGYLNEKAQFDNVIKAKETLLEDNGLFIVDPKMGRGGNLYKQFDEDIIVGMMDISSIADYVIPNITEAMLLTHNSKYQDIQDDYYINELIADLYRNGAKNVVLTSVQDDSYSIGCISYDGLTKTTVLKEKMEGEFKGTGDIFKAFIVGSIISGKTIKDSMDMACDFVMDSIEDTFIDQNHNHAIKFEEALAKYTHIKPNPGWE
ncbi:MAG: bifunctional hydroxymethylpyrimidine kinase/phosphomethylpyrimidine kinase [Acholeplasmatales bacterium]|nr:bifunctional hydroxymethylpyrimidine kinase/phosphomethylpyrimidine kinase [Acholeplasmatales bacterium]